MSDIEQRLRAIDEVAMYEAPATTEAIIREAADELARLEADNASLRSRLEEVEGARDRERRRATDAEYMAVAVKPLTWNEGSFAHTDVGILYRVIQRPDFWLLEKITGSSTFKSAHPSEKAAKAAAQADYASRIRSALVATPPAERVVETLTPDIYSKAWRDQMGKLITDDMVILALDAVDPDWDDEFSRAKARSNSRNWMRRVLRITIPIAAALAAKPAVKDDETVVRELPPTREYVDRIVRIFRDRPADDTSAVVLQDYARAALAANGGRS